MMWSGGGGGGGRWMGAGVGEVFGGLRSDQDVDVRERLPVVDSIISRGGPGLIFDLHAFCTHILEISWWGPDH